MNIYTMKSPIKGDAFYFKELHLLNSKWHQSAAGIAGRKNGDAIETFWGVDSEDKPLGDLIMFIFYGLASSKLIVEKFRKFAPENTINPIVVDGENDKFAFIQPKNYAEIDVNVEHMFLIFSKYKSLLVTEKLKNEWERLKLTGAEFEFVFAADDARFISVD